MLESPPGGGVRRGKNADVLESHIQRSLFNFSAVNPGPQEFLNLPQVITEWKQGWKSPLQVKIRSGIWGEAEEYWSPKTRSWLWWHARKGWKPLPRETQVSWDETCLCCQRNSRAESLGYASCSSSQCPLTTLPGEHSAPLITTFWLHKGMAKASKWPYPLHWSGERTSKAKYQLC